MEDKNIEQIEETVNEKPKKKTAKKKKKKKTKTFKDIKKAMENTEVLIANNDDAMFFYRCPKTGVEVDLREYGDTEIVEAEVLYTMKNSKKIFNKYLIIILDVYSDDDDITIEDVYAYLGIDKLYKNIEIPSSEYLDELLLEETVERFERVIDGMSNNMFKRLANRAIMLAKRGQLSNSHKIRMIEDKLKMPELFYDIENKRKSR